MTLTLILPWFPIILAVGVGARLLGPTRGLGLGMVCALFWIVLSQALGGTQVWLSASSALSIGAGALAIVAMGAWAGESPIVLAFRGGEKAGATYDPRPVPEPGLRQIADAIDRFDDWLLEHRHDANPWPAFDEFVRTVLHNACDATHVRPYRLTSEGNELIPLREADPLADDHRRPAQAGIIGKVIASGRAFVADADPIASDAAQASHADDEAIAWCFAVKRAGKPVGVVCARHLDLDPARCSERLRTAERLISQFWVSLEEACLSRSATQDDPISGLHSREAFLRLAERSLRDSYAQGEPVAVGVIALEQLRELNDSGRWEAADELVAEVGRVLRRKVRMDDRLGRFDGSRFVVLFRRVDAELASLIAAQVMSRLASVCSDEARWHAPIGVRCGIATGSGSCPPLRELVSAALQQCRRARQQDRPIAIDATEPATAEVPQP